MYVTPSLFWTDVFSILVILLGIGNLWTGEGQRVNWKLLGSHILPLSGIVILSIISIFTALLPRLAGYYAARLCLNYLTLWILVTNKMDFKRIAWVFIGGMVCQSVVGVTQFLTRGPLNLPGEMALALDQFGAARIAVSGRRWLRAYGLTFHPNVLGGFLVVGLALGLPLLKRVGARLMWCLLLAGLVLSFSRSAWFAAGIVLALLIVWVLDQFPSYRRPLFFMIMGITATGLVGVLLLLGQIKTRLQPFQSFAEFTSLYERGQLIEIALDVISRRPLTGIGIGNFPLAVLNSQADMRIHFVHHVPLLLASESGFLAGVCWYLMWLAPIFILWRNWDHSAIWPIVYGGGWFAFGMIGLWDSYPWNLEVGRVLSVILLAGLYQSLLQDTAYESNP